ncbi:hypothetical protein PVK06_040015 [Gossypium arboreum]|uniref:Uncharacterized protein n=1 Tax=Gossypium arboreum TaxID=29729 RepID=A0ABR0N4C2_GOSAR|nr:hypothetical protein PVK06_040015 [Gossypium arboreum]
MERWRESSRASDEGRNGSYGGLARGSHFAVLGVSEGEISAVFNSEINWSDEIVTKKKSNGDGDMGLGFLEKDVIETKGKQSKLRAKGKKVVMGGGPKSALKVLKPNNGSLGMNLNIRWEQSVDLQLAMEGLVCDLKRNSNKDVMVLDPQVVGEGMIVDDIDGVEVSGAKGNGIITKIGYLNSFRVKMNCFARGICLCWNKDVMVDILNIHSQVVHVKICSTNHFICSTVYASSHAMKTDELWHFLCFLVVSVEGPSMLAGGFNSILDRGERKGGASISLIGSNGLERFIRQ